VNTALHPLPVPPDALFVAAGDALLLFPSVEAAETSLPTLDVQEGSYPRAYGISGEIYRIGCDLNRVRIEPTGEPKRPDELKALLLRHLEDCEDPADAIQPLEEIVALAWAIERDFQVRCGPDANRFATPVSMLSFAGIALALATIWYFGFR
jgi:hypothetical protein